MHFYGLAVGPSHCRRIFPTATAPRETTGGFGRQRTAAIFGQPYRGRRPPRGRADPVLGDTGLGPVTRGPVTLEPVTRGFVEPILPKHGAALLPVFSGSLHDFSGITSHLEEYRVNTGNTGVQPSSTPHKKLNVLAMFPWALTHLPMYVKAQRPPQALPVGNADTTAARMAWNEWRRPWRPRTSGIRTRKCGKLPAGAGLDSDLLESKDSSAPPFPTQNPRVCSSSSPGGKSTNVFTRASTRYACT